MGMFDDLIPSAAAKAGGGMFDDLIPSGIDFSRPVKEVRAEIAKLPESQRKAALDQWADAYVAEERKGVKRMDIPGVVNPQRLPDVVRNFAKGTIVGSFADELNAATNAGLHNITGGAFGAPYDESVAYQRAVDRALKNESPVGSTVTQVAGGLASGGPVAKAVFNRVKSVPGRMAAGGGFGTAYSYLSGAGEAEGDLEQRHEAGVDAAPTGLAVGSVLPPAISGGAKVAGMVSDAVSPTIARVGAWAQDIPRRIGMPASADGAMPGTRGSNAAAEQVIANQLHRAGISPDDLRAEIARIDEAGRFHTSGHAQDATALVDLDPSLQRLAGSAARQSPEAANTAKTFMEARQTGLTPVGKEPVQVAQTGLPTRPRLAKPITGGQAEETLGSRFNTQENDIVPMGQGERIEDALKRSLLIKDTAHHGHASSASRTSQQISEAAKAEAKPAYEAAYRAGDNVDIRPAIVPVLTQWLKGDRLANEAEPVRALVARVAGLFAPKGNVVSTVEKFDRTKQFIDGKIDRLFESLEGRNRYVGGLLNEFKNDLLRAMDAIKANNLGALYKEARGNWGSHAEARKAIELGQSVWKADSEVGIDAYRAMQEAGLEKLFRLGMLEGYRTAARTAKRGADKTALFDNPRIDALLAEVIPRTETSTGRVKMVGGAPAEFSNRPERFGRFIDNEKRMAETPRVVQGGSPTQRNIKDDEAYNIMNKFSETIEQFRSSASVAMLGVRAAEQLLSKLFGMRADTAQSIARMLFNADPIVRARVLNAVEARYGRDRLDQFTRLMEEYQRSVSAATSRQAAMPEGQ